VDWKIAEDTVVQTDNMVVCGEVTNPSYLEKPPVLVFEVLSASTEQKDRVLETVQYAKGGLQ
jgi:Uma2 family endonuclease